MKTNRSSSAVDDLRHALVRYASDGGDRPQTHLWRRGADSFVPFVFGTGELCGDATVRLNLRGESLVLGTEPRAAEARELLGIGAGELHASTVLDTSQGVKRARRPRILDLFCCQGGAGAGYAAAGFEVVGVDIAPQPRYPFTFHRGDALEALRANGDSFDAVHASPPCRAHTKAQRLQGNEHPELIEPVREALMHTGLPYVIENVEGAPLRDPVMLCGTMFGLRLYRHRLFETNWPLTAPLHGQHYLRQVKMGRSPGPDDILQPVGHFSGVQEARDAMAMPWANQDGLREAIPPAYTEYIGRELIAHLEARHAA